MRNVYGFHSQFDCTHTFSNFNEDEEWTGEADEWGVPEGFLNAVQCCARCQRWKSTYDPFYFIAEITAMGLQIAEWQAEHPLPRDREVKKQIMNAMADKTCKNAPLPREGDPVEATTPMPPRPLPSHSFGRVPGC